MRSEAWRRDVRAIHRGRAAGRRPAQAEARGRRHSYIGTEPLLLGLIQDPEGVGGLVLAELVDDVGAVRGTVIASLPAAETVAPRGFAAGPVPPVGLIGDPGSELTCSGDLHRLLMRAGARALDAGRTEITVADVEGVLRREPPRAAAG